MPVFSETEYLQLRWKIKPAGNVNSYDVRNGLLLRAYIHLLFDKGLISIGPVTLNICVY